MRAHSEALTALLVALTEDEQVAVVTALDEAGQGTYAPSLAAFEAGLDGDLETAALRPKGGLK